MSKTNRGEDSDTDTEEDEAEESRWRSRMTLQRMRSTGTTESRQWGGAGCAVSCEDRLSRVRCGPSPGSPTSFSSRSPFAEEAASAERPKPHKTFTRLRKTGSKRSKTEVFGRNVARFADEEISPRSAMRRAGTSRRLNAQT
eukprot:jgi/Tetstr1/431096/TSEL_020812.t1